MENQVNVTPSKETNKALKEMEIYEVLDKEFKIILLKKFNE